MTDDTTRKQTKQAQTGDLETVSCLVERLRGPLFAIAYRELRHYDNAHDAVANALLRIVRHLPRLRDPDQVQAWAARIVRNEARRLLRLDIERELRSVPRDQARASALFYFEGRSVSEIAFLLDRPEGTVKYYLHRTRGRLRDRLRKDYLMDTPLTPTPVLTAVIAGDNFVPATPTDIEQALRRAGWQVVRHVTDVPGLTAPAGPRGYLTTPLSDAQFVVIGEHVGGRSAFELSALWRASDKGKALTLLLLIDGSRPTVETESMIMAAYGAGFDWLFTRPVDLADVEGAARKTREMLEAAVKAEPKAAHEVWETRRECRTIRYYPRPVSPGVYYLHATRGTTAL